MISHLTELHRVEGQLILSVHPVFVIGLLLGTVILSMIISKYWPNKKVKLPPIAQDSQAGFPILQGNEPKHVQRIPL